jgi:prepilin-type processing-associated H-X9-DG protein/prepilin-type N-terminal cleavage/methylation domain-containing protein
MRLNYYIQRSISLRTYQKIESQQMIAEKAQLHPLKWVKEIQGESSAKRSRRRNYSSVATGLRSMSTRMHIQSEASSSTHCLVNELKQTRTRCRGRFTLIELLLVISIIAILSSMLLPALKHVRDQASSVQCVNHLKQIGLALMMYGNDNNQTIPVYDTFTSWPVHYARWQDFIIGYIYPQPGTLKSNSFLNNSIPIGIFRCPSQRNPDKFQSYGINYYWQPGTATQKHCTIKAIRRPSERMAVMDSSKISTSNNSVINDFDQIGWRHSGGTNVLYWDFHAINQPMNQISLTAWEVYFWGQGIKN